MAGKTLKSKEQRNLLATPEVERKRGDRKGSSRRRRSSLTDHNKNKPNEGDLNLPGTNNVEETKRPISREERAQIKFGHPIYSKAASLFESLKGTMEDTLKLDFENEFEKRRAYSLALAAKRCECIDIIYKQLELELSLSFFYKQSSFLLSSKNIVLFTSNFQFPLMFNILMIFNYFF